MLNTADVIIVGAGVQGASLAFHLTKLGLKPLVLERRFVASGATGRSSGMVRMHYDLEVEVSLAWLSFQYFRNWSEMVGGECDFTRTGFIQIVTPEYQDALHANTAMNQQVGVPSLLIAPDDVRRLAPHFATDDFQIAVYEPESGYADPSATTMSLMQAARRQGAQLVQDCQVLAIQVVASKVSGVQSTQGSFSAPVVVNAAGPWAGEINRMVGLDIPIETWRHDTLLAQRPHEMGTVHPAVIDFINAMYFRPETGGLTLVGLEDDNPLGESLDGDIDHAQPGYVERAIPRICQRIPIMEFARLHSAHGGYDGITTDQRPVLGQAGPDGFYLDCGFSGTGFKIAPAVGACMAELIVNGQAHTIDITPFAPQRFAEDKQLVGEHPYTNIWR